MNIVDDWLTKQGYKKKESQGEAVEALPPRSVLMHHPPAEETLAALPLSATKSAQPWCKVRRKGAKMPKNRPPRHPKRSGIKF